jgi:hypothetical protein
MDHLLIILALVVGGLAGTALTQKDPVSALLSALQRRGVGFILGSLGLGFTAEVLWKIICSGR